jgi:hypothetical protein
VSLVICVILTAFAIFRIVAANSSISVAYDEPAHIACGMEWLDKGTFTLEPLHPPLARIAAAIGPYLAGARLPQVQMISDPAGDWYDIYPAGNEILSTHDRYAHNLALARLGEIPFFLLGVSLVFLWTRDLYGPRGALIAVLLYTTLPAVLAFAGLAYVDFALSVFLPCTLFALVRWLQRPSWGRGATLGVMAGLAVLSNLSALMFLPVCIIPIAICWIWKKGDSNDQFGVRRYAATVVAALLICAVVIWGGYRFSMKPLNQVLAKPAQDVAQLPPPVRRIAGAIVDLDPPLPAPEFFKGILASWMQNRKSPPSYALGQIRRGGFWYFYYVDLGLKTPLAFLALALCGLFWTTRSSISWQALAPAVSAVAILLVSMVVKVDFGIRHVLFLYPLLTVVAAGGALRLWQHREHRPWIGPAALCVLLVGQVVSSVSAHPDYIAYFNLLAGKHPEERFLFGCDLDCGQDVGQLSKTVGNRGITHLTLQLWTSADLHRMNLPPFDTLSPYERHSGWIAISVLYLRSGDAIRGGRNRDEYAWLNSYTPVEYVGKTIRLYYIPAKSEPVSQSRTQPSPLTSQRVAHHSSLNMSAFPPELS